MIAFLALAIALAQQHEHPAGPWAANNRALEILHPRVAAGAAWQPGSSPLHACPFMRGDRLLMLHDNIPTGNDFQSPPRGGDQGLSTTWFIAMANRPLAGGNHSLEPATFDRDEDPLFLQTGESLEDRPLYGRPLSDEWSLPLRLPPSGGPEFGLHRQDPPPIRFSVLMAGFSTPFAEVEGSWLKGREPDEDPWDFVPRTPDSESARLTASATADLPFGKPRNWATTLAYEQNRGQREETPPSVALGTMIELDATPSPFGRAEGIRKPGSALVLGPALRDRAFGVSTFVLGYAYHFEAAAGLQPGLGFCLSVDVIDRHMEPLDRHRTDYGFMVFFHLWPERRMSLFRPRDAQDR